MSDSVTIVVIDDNELLGDDLEANVPYDARKRDANFWLRWYATSSEFFDDLASEEFTREIQYVIIDQVADETTGNREQGAKVDLPRLDALRAMQNGSRLKNARFFIFTGETEDDALQNLRAEIKALGAVDVWQKPGPSQSVASWLVDKIFDDIARQR